MSYTECRNALALVLKTADIEHVFTTPVGNIVAGDVPCFIMYGSSGNTEFTFGGGAMPEEHHTERVVLLVSDAKLEDAAEMTWSIRADTLDAISNQGALSGNGYITGVSWNSPSAYQYGGRDYSGMEFHISFVLAR